MASEVPPLEREARAFIRHELADGAPAIVTSNFRPFAAVMLHLKAELNFHRLFSDAVEDFSEARLTAAQGKALKAAGLE